MFPISFHGDYPGWSLMKKIENWVAKRRVRIVFIILVVALLASGIRHLPGGDDWETFRGGALRIIRGEDLYGSPITFSYFYNPPWLGVLLVPFALLPFDWGRGMLSAVSLSLLFLVGLQWKLSPLKMAFMFLSPPILYILLHGQIDALVFSAVLLPVDWWPVVAITKPQVALGLLFNIIYTRNVRQVVFLALVLGASVLAFGLWPLKLLNLPRPFVDSGHNLWSGIWPLTIPVGVVLISLGIKEKNGKLLLAGSPFLSPYCPISTLLGPWVVLLSLTDEWIAALALAAWWLAILLPNLYKFS